MSVDGRVNVLLQVEKYIKLNKNTIKDRPTARSIGLISRCISRGQVSHEFNNSSEET